MQTLELLTVVPNVADYLNHEFRAARFPRVQPRSLYAAASKLNSYYSSSAGSGVSSRRRSNVVSPLLALPSSTTLMLLFISGGTPTRSESMKRCMFIASTSLLQTRERKRKGERTMLPKSRCRNRSLQILYPVLPLCEPALPHHLPLVDGPVESTFVRPRFAPRRSPPRTHYCSLVRIEREGV